MVKRIFKQLVPGVFLGVSPGGHPWYGGRAHLYFYDQDEVHKQTIGFEWTFLKNAKYCGLELHLNSVDGCRGIMFYIGLYKVANLWLTIEQVPKWLLPGHYRQSVIHEGEIVWQPEDRTIGVRIFNWTIWVSLWENQMEWNRTDPWWWRFNINIPDLVLGRDKFTKRELVAGICTVPMPEGGYSAHYTVSEFEWRRPRWPWPRRKTYIDIEVDSQHGIPLPGKGENSWDCDDDAAYAIGMELVGTVKDAALHFAHRIVRDRVNRCGREIYP